MDPERKERSRQKQIERAVYQQIAQRNLTSEKKKEAHEVKQEKETSSPEICEIESKNGSPSWCYIFSCPNCPAKIQVMPNELNCKQFRCGSKLNPHASKVECEKAVAEGTTDGCGAAFTFDGQKVLLSEYK